MIKTNIYKWKMVDAYATLLKLALNTDIGSLCQYINSLQKCIEIVNRGA